MDARQRLIAGLSAKLYHITGVSAAASILTNNTFDLKPADGNESEEAHGLAYYLSMARFPNSGYMRRSITQFSVIFELDGRKMNQRYRGAPVDYWQANHYDNPDYDESEDRLFSDKPRIPAIPFITAVHCQINSKEGLLYKIWRVCKARKIPLYFYDDNARMLTLRPKNAVEYRPKFADAPARQLTEYDYKYRTPAESTLRAWLNLYRINFNGRNPREASRANKRLASVYDGIAYDDHHKQLSAEMHNAKSTPYGSTSQERETLDMLIKIMRANKWNAKQYTDAMRRKWYGR